MDKYDSPTTQDMDDIASINDQAQFILDEILTNPKSICIINKSGDIKYYAPNGQGAHFSSDMAFKGFIERIMQTNNGFAVEFSSDLDYEDMVANVLYEEETVAIVSQENGLENLEIEFFSSADAKPWKFVFEGFLNALQHAKECLTRMQKYSE